MHIARLLVLPLILLGVAVMAAPVTNDDVVKMVRAGLDESIILSAIENGEPQFDTTTDGLIDLSDAKVPKAIVTAVIERASGKNKGASKAAGTVQNSSDAEEGDADVQALMVVDGETQTRLTYAKSNMQTRVRGLGFGGGGVYLSMDGSNAKIRLKNTSPTFLVWLPVEAQPETQVDLTLWAIRKNGVREIICANAGFASGTTGFPKERLIAMTFTKTGEQALGGKYLRYELTPSRTLVAGEYALVMGDQTPRCFDFGIDP